MGTCSSEHPEMAHRVHQSTSGPTSKGRKGIGKAEIILVYNVDSGVLNSFKDLLHRTLAPTTYECGLRSTTCGVLGIRRSWKAYIAGSDVPITLLRRDEFKETYPKVDALYPAGFLKRGKKIEQFILSREIDHCKDVACLEGLIKKKLDAEEGKGAP
jgi:hypothetical protein